MFLYLLFSNHFLATRTLFPPSHYCTNSKCPKSGEKMLHDKDGILQAVLFTLADGACPTYAVHLYCCRA